MTHPPGTVLFAAPNDELSLIEALAYIDEHKLTSENAKIVRRESDNQILIITKVEVKI